MQRCAPVRLVRRTASQSSAFMRTAKPSRVMAALFTRMSSRPNVRGPGGSRPSPARASATSIWHGQRFAARGGDFCTTGPQLFRIARGSDDTRAGLRQGKRRGAPDSLRRAGHQRYSIFQAEHNRNRRCTSRMPRFPHLRLRACARRSSAACSDLASSTLKHVHRAVDLPQQAAEHAAGPDFDKRRGALLDQFAHGVFPAHGQASPGGPALRGPLAAGDDAGVDIGDQRNAQSAQTCVARRSFSRRCCAGRISSL